MECNKLKTTEILWSPKAPVSWEVKRGKILFKSKKDINDKMQCKERLALTLKGVIDRFEGDNIGLNPNDLRTYQIFNKDDLVFKLIDLANKRTSRVGYVHKKGIMSSAYIRLIGNKKHNMRYFYYQYYDLYQRFIFNSLGQGVRATLSPSDLLNISILVPPLEIQNRIATYLDKKNKKIDKFIRNKERLIELLEEDFKRKILLNVLGEKLESEMKNTEKFWIGKIPKNWNIIKIRRLIIEHKQGFYTTDPYIDQGIKLLRITDLCKDSSIKYDDMPFVSISKNDYTIFKIKNGDFIFARTGSIGQFGFVENPENAVFASYLIRFRFKKDIYIEFLRYALRSSYFIDGLLMSIHGGVNQNVHAENIKNQFIAIPNSEQEIQKIVARLKENERRTNLAISKAQKEISLIKKYRESLITQLVTGQLKAPDLMEAE